MYISGPVRVHIASGQERGGALWSESGSQHRFCLLWMERSLARFWCERFREGDPGNAQMVQSSDAFENDSVDILAAGQNKGNGDQTSGFGSCAD